MEQVKSYNNFTFYNPTKIIFGAKTILQLRNLIPKESKILMTYGGGSIKKNGVYDQVKEALKEHTVLEFSGISPNPKYEHSMKAVEICKKENIDFLLAVGGGSVIDATKFISIAAKYEYEDPWDLIIKKFSGDSKYEPKAAIPIGTVITLPATASEMNAGFVLSRESTKQKYDKFHTLLFPKFSILDPETTYTLPKNQTINGAVDTFIHIIEQYVTTNRNTRIPDRISEGLLDTIISETPKVLENPKDYSARANLMWSSTLGLNYLISTGVDQDWAIHQIGHEITAMTGADHAKTLAAILPGMWKYKKEQKKEKLAMMAERVYGKKEGTDDEKADFTIQKTIEFFNSIGMKTTLSSAGIGKENFNELIKRIEDRENDLKAPPLGENADIYAKDIIKILELCDL
ncbi:iron-containing alcohol dehydrogenase [Anaeramoeba ignava]|uniref:Iron-containing alcohol dehydrogenase n=1 Tax=Anaeramoeba ignava TaxID=1746090 RepID=A0A9Q0L5Q3_ANAIG|nr:iron-containing alcohol dehydrogenase [Anaeramoeba ignava]